MTYGQQYSDMEATPPLVAWRMLRGLRHRPPGRAKRGERKETFDASLEQAGQFFAAAATAGSATRPVLVFYGLLQAGRAVAAANTKADNNHWRLSGGHGIKCDQLHQSATTQLASLTMINAPTGSFIELAEILRAASLPTPTQIGDIWCLLMELERFPLDGMGAARPLTLRYHAESTGVDGGLLTVGRLPIELIQVRLDRVDPARDWPSRGTKLETIWIDTRDSVGARRACRPTDH